MEADHEWPGGGRASVEAPLWVEEAAGVPLSIYGYLVEERKSEGEGRAPRCGGAARPWERQATGKRLGTTLTAGPSRQRLGERGRRSWAGRDGGPNWAAEEIWTAVKKEKERGELGWKITGWVEERERDEGKVECGFSDFCDFENHTATKKSCKRI